MASHEPPATGGNRAADGVVTFPFGEPDQRLEDYLDDKLQSTADFATLDVLLDAVHEQNKLLRVQLDGTAEDLAAARAAAVASQERLRAQMDEFAALEAVVDKRLVAANATDAVPEAVVQRLTGPLQQLQRVSLAHDYLVLLQEVTALATAVRTTLVAKATDEQQGLGLRAALAPYTRLRKLAARVAMLRVPVDGAAAHLAAHVSNIANAVWAELYTAMREAYAVLLLERGWPGGVDAAVRADETWREAFAELVELQVPAVREAATTTATTTSPEPVVLLPLDVMADLFVKEFRYHFLSLSSGRKTSDPRQIADVCFPWFLDRVATWAPFLRASFADRLAQHFTGTAAADRSVYVDPACAFVAALLPAMREKVQQSVAFAVQLCQSNDMGGGGGVEHAVDGGADAKVATAAGPTFLGTLLVQLLVFDDELRTRFCYDGGCAGGAAAWPGLTAAVLEKHFGLWLQTEKAYALARYRDIVGGGSASASSASASASTSTSTSTGVSVSASATLDYDYNGPGKTKPTLAAVRVMDLLGSVTAQYRRVRQFGQRLRFLMDIQITVLDAYHDRLRDALEAYYAMTSTVARTLHGVSREQLAALEGTGALEVLCRVYGSADHVIEMLRAWGDDAFFVQLWDDLETRAARANPSKNDGLGDDNDANSDADANADAEDTLAGQVRQRSSAAGRRTIASEAEAAVEGSLFDETIEAFAQRRKAAQELLVTALVDANRKAFRPYVLRTHWTAVAAKYEGEATPSTLDTGADDATVTPELDEPLRVLHRNLGFLNRALGTAVLRRTVRMALEKLQDMLWGEVLLAQRFTALGAAQFARDVDAMADVLEWHVARSSAALAGLREGVQLLTLPTVATTQGTVTLSQASDRVFTDNIEAKQLLQELGLTLLTPATARLVLQRRLENK